MEHPLFTGSVIFSLISGTAAGILSILAFEILRRSPFGRAVFVLSIVMTIFVIYHAVLIISPGGNVIVSGFESLLFTGVTGFVWMMVWTQWRIQQQTHSGVSTG